MLILKKYPLVFKVNVISNVNKNGDNINELAKRFGIAPGTILRWMNNEKLLVYYKGKTPNKSNLIIENTKPNVIIDDIDLNLEILSEVTNKNITIKCKITLKH